MKRIFISSTFNDMQAERDEIQKNILPALRAAARRYGEDIEISDLRWGVNTSDLDSEEGSRKVLSVCLDEIDKCKPYMIVLLGERYGWVPDSKLIKNAAQRKNFELSDLEKSVTALEIEYGALSDPESLKNTIFMFREPIIGADSSYRSEGEERMKLEALKARIRKLAEGRVFEYSVKWDKEKKRPAEMEQFSQILKEQLVSVLEKEFEKTAMLTSSQREAKKHWSRVESKALGFSGREALLSECRERIEGGNRSLILTGASGNGKSELSARLISDYREQGWYVVPFVCGSGGQRNSCVDALMHLVSRLEEDIDPEERPKYQYDVKKMMGDAPSDGNLSSLMIRLEMMLRKYYLPKGIQVLFAVIGAEKLEQDEYARSFRYIPELKPDNLHVLVTCDEHYNTAEFIGQRAEVPELRADEKEEIVSAMMAFYGKEPGREVMEEIVKKEQSGKLLYLSLLVQYLLTFDQEDYAAIKDLGNDMIAISLYQKQIVRDMPNSIFGLSRYIFKRLEEKSNDEFISSVVEFIAASRFGLREQDLKSLLERRNIPWSSILFSRLINYSSVLFSEWNGRFDFSNTALKKEIRSQYDLDKTYSEIFYYILGLPDDDPFKSGEMFWYCQRFNEPEHLLSYILSLAGMTERKKISPEPIKKIMRDVLRGEACAFFARAIKDTKQVYALPGIYNIWAEHIMDDIDSRSWAEKDAARIICDTICDKFEKTDTMGVFSFAVALLKYRSGSIYLKQRYYKEALYRFEESRSLAYDLYKNSGKKQYFHLIGEIMRLSAQAYGGLSNSEGEEALYADASSVFSALYNAAPTHESALELCEVLYERALFFWRKKRVMESEPLCKTVIDLCGKAEQDNARELFTLKRLNIYKNSCEMLSYIYDIRNDTPNPAPIEDILKLNSKIKLLERTIEDRLYHPDVITRYVRELKKFAVICKEAGYIIGATHDLVLAKDMLRWAMEYGGGYPCITGYYRSCAELGDHYCELGLNDEALNNYLEELQYRRRIFREHAFFGNAHMLSQSLIKTGRLLFEMGNLWAAYEAFRESVSCFDGISDMPASIVESDKAEGAEYMDRLICMLMPWKCGKGELEAKLKEANALLNSGKVLPW